MTKLHKYSVQTVWTGNLGRGTEDYRAYSRNHECKADAAAHAVECSSDPHFLGDASRHNPEQLLVAALSSCHMLSFLHLCADAGINVTAYTDQATGAMRQNEDGSGEFTNVTLRPNVEISDPTRFAELDALHHHAHELCFIARSVNFPVLVEPRTH